MGKTFDAKVAELDALALKMADDNPNHGVVLICTDSSTNQVATRVHANGDLGMAVAMGVQNMLNKMSNKPITPTTLSAVIEQMYSNNRKGK